jgi:hypothetical protein
MAEEKAASAVNKVDTSGAHDRVAMLSLRADGTPDQTAPEIIGDKDAAVAAAKVQFAQQAVSAVDEVKRPELDLGGTVAGEEAEDPSIAELKKAHDSAAKAAESKAVSVVNGLHQG